MSTATEAKVVSEEVSEMAKRIAKEIKLADDGLSVEIPKDLYVNTLPEGITESQIKAVQQHNSTFFPAMTMAVGEVAINAFKKNKDLESVEAKAKLVSRDAYEVTIKREQEQRNPHDGSKTTVYGAPTSKVVTYAAKSKGQDMAAVSASLKAKALAAYGS